MTNSYATKKKLTQPLGNNAFAWEEREVLYGHSPVLTIPSLIDGTLEDVIIWDDIVFEELDDWVLKSCKWLRHFVELLPSYYPTIPPVTIFDNHNHALYFWIDAMRRWIIAEWFELIHIDEHSDLWDNTHDFDRDRAITDESYAWEFTNLKCNVGNYIQPALRNWLVGKMIRIENEHEIDRYIDYVPPKNSILNLDIDIFAPELDHISEEKKIKIIRNLMNQVSYVTIATSPYFIDQWKAIEKIQKIMIGI